jgi:hypothetical protein
MKISHQMDQATCFCGEGCSISRDTLSFSIVTYVKCTGSDALHSNVIDEDTWLIKEILNNEIRLKF